MKHWTRCWGTKLIGHKWADLQLGWAPSGDILDFQLRWNRRQDHAGISLNVEVFGLHVYVTIYDRRHWNEEKKRWYLDGEKEEPFDCDNLECEKTHLEQEVEGLRHQVLTCEFTGLKNDKAFRRDDDLMWKTEVAIELCALRDIQASDGHVVAEYFLAELGAAILDSIAKQKNAFFYYRYGDELAARFKEKSDLEVTMTKLKEDLGKLTIRFEHGGKTYCYQGIEIRYAHAENYEKAYRLLIPMRTTV